MLPLRQTLLVAALAACLGGPVLARNDHGGGGHGKAHAGKHEKHAGKHAAKAVKKAHKAVRQVRKEERREDRREARREERRDGRQVARHDGRRDLVRSTAVLGAAPAAALAVRPDREAVRVGGWFTDTHRTVVRRYVSTHPAGLHCPPGLAKKGNGCLPPGQAKKYALGQPLPGAVAWTAVPPPLLAQLPPPPLGYQYARVDNDLLLMALSTAVVVDVLAGLLG